MKRSHKLCAVMIDTLGREVSLSHEIYLHCNLSNLLS